MIRAGEIRKGNVIEYRSQLWMALDTQITYVGKRGAYVQVKMQNLDDEHIEIQRFSTSDNIERVFVETRSMTYLYHSGTGFVFMVEETGEQIELSNDRMEDVAPYLPYNAEVTITFCKGKPVGVELPPSVQLEVTHTDPAVRGDTATNVTKPAETETGLTVKVPGYIEIGEVIKVDTRTGEFQGRA